MVAEKDKSGNDKSEGPVPEKSVDVPICGLIMPISSTENHDEKHWAAVQTLLHRGIRSAGLSPVNVWEGVNDRISKRIVSNIFRQDVVVADISDLNPNVMLELGLRLASKKPTVIVFNKGGKIPFDITDVEALPYPADLNILEMESFFDKFSKLLKDRLQSFKDNTYESYLADVVVEVLEPQTKSVSAESLILEKLDSMAVRMSSLERSIPGRSSVVNRSGPARIRTTILCWVPDEAADAFTESLPSLAEVRGFISQEGKTFYKLLPLGDRPLSLVRDRLFRLLDQMAGGFDVPDSVSEVLDLLG